MPPPSTPRAVPGTPPGSTVPAGPGRTVPAGRGHGQWRTYDVTDGLAGAEIYCICQDRAGNLWFGTRDSGLSRFDGQKWRTYSMPDGPACSADCVFEDLAGNLWFGTVGGVVRFDGERWRTFTPGDGQWATDAWIGAADRHGNVWFARAGVVTRYDGETWETLPAVQGHPDLGAILIDGDGRIWIGTSRGDLCRYNGSGWITFRVPDGTAGGPVRCILEGVDGALWLSVGGHGLSRYDGECLAAISVADGLPSNDVRCLLRDGEGALWIGTWGAVDGTGSDTNTSRRRTSCRTGTSRTCFRIARGMSGWLRSGA